MRTRITASIGLVALVVAVMVALDRVLPAGPPIRLGMTGEEVDRALDEPKNSKMHHPSSDEVEYYLKPGWLGDDANILVLFDDTSDKGRVIGWEIRQRMDYRYRSWWDRLKYVNRLK